MTRPRRLSTTVCAFHLGFGLVASVGCTEAQENSDQKQSERIDQINGKSADPNQDAQQSRVQPNGNAPNQIVIKGDTKCVEQTKEALNLLGGVVKVI